jgi:PIN domain nuclease of toxin-antitoxin system
LNLLLDTCVVLWLILETKQVPEPVMALLLDPANKRFLSVASVWEIVVKWQSGKLTLPKPPVEMLAEFKRRGRVAALPLEDTAVFQLSKLPKLHNDPFDRMLICQAIEGGMTIVTPDDQINQYPIKTLWG